MVGMRPSREDSTKMGVVPYNGSGSNKYSSNRGNTGNNNTNANYSQSEEAGNPSSYPSQKSASNDQLWQNNGNGAPQGWPETNQRNGGNWQGSQNNNGPPAPQQSQQPANLQQSNIDPRKVQDGYPIPANPNVRQIGNNQGQTGARNSQGALIPQESVSNRGPMPKGDYVYYDGNGNQIQPPNGALGPPNGGSGSEKHFHHHYYYHQQPTPQLGYPNDKNVQKKKRSPAAAALIAALVTCWACTCCCHVPCGC